MWIGHRKEIRRKLTFWALALRLLYETRGPFLKDPEKFTHPKSFGKISSLIQFQSCFIRIFFIDMNMRRFVHIRSFISVHPLVLWYRLSVKMTFRSRKFSGAFQTRAPKLS